MLIPDQTGHPSESVRLELQQQVADLFLQLFRQLNSGPVWPWLELDLTMPQLKMLMVVDWLGPLPMSQVAGQLGIGVSTATGLIDRLVEHGLVQREHDPRDRRVVQVEATPEGRGLVRELRSASGERLGRVLEHLSAEDLRRCARAMASVSGAADSEFPVEQSIPAALGAAGAAEARR